MGIEVGGLIGLIILIADIWAIVNVLGSPASTGSKVLWVVIILVLPVIGLIALAAHGPAQGRHRHLSAAAQRTETARRAHNPAGRPASSSENDRATAQPAP